MEYETWNCADCGTFAGTATALPEVINGPADTCRPSEYVTEPPETCPDCGGDNLEGEVV
jgi:hypothetical protein